MAITFQGKDFQVFSGGSLTGIAASGGTGTVTYAIPANYVVLLKATILMCNTGTSGLTAAAGLQAEFVVANYGGSGATPGALSGGVNPANSSTAGLLGADAQGSDLNGIGGSASPPTAVWTRSTTNAILTITNNYVTSSADALVYLEIYPAKNV
jgi:hypothetical protein